MDAGFVQTKLTLLMGESFLCLQGVDIPDSVRTGTSTTTNAQSRLKDKCNSFHSSAIVNISQKLVFDPVQLPHDWLDG